MWFYIGPMKERAKNGDVSPRTLVELEGSEEETEGKNEDARQECSALLQQGHLLPSTEAS
jgi:hypothetical protein